MRLKNGHLIIRHFITANIVIRPSGRGNIILFTVNFNIESTLI